MLDQQNGDAACRDVAHHFKNLVHHDGRQAHGGLVQQQHFGPAHECAAHGQHLLLAARHGAGQLVFAFFEARKNTEHHVNVVGDFRLVFADVGAHLQVFGDGHAREDAAAFRHHGQAFAHQVPGALALDAFAHVLDVAFGRCQRAGDGFHGGGFAGAVGADERDELAFADFEVNALDGLDAAVGDFQAGDFEQ